MFRKSLALLMVPIATIALVACGGEEPKRLSDMSHPERTQWAQQHDATMTAQAGGSNGGGGASPQGDIEATQSAAAVFTAASEGVTARSSRTPTLATATPEVSRQDLESAYGVAVMIYTSMWQTEMEALTPLLENPKPTDTAWRNDLMEQADAILDVTAGINAMNSPSQRFHEFHSQFVQAASVMSSAMHLLKSGTRSLDADTIDAANALMQESTLLISEAAGTFPGLND